MSDVASSALPNSVAVAPAEASDGAGRSVVIATIAMTLIVFALVAAGMSAITGSTGIGLALGAFCSAWVGPGFGVIVGGVRSVLQSESVDIQSRIDAGVGGQKS